MWTLKNMVISPKFYEILINTDLKGETSLELDNLYNHIKMYLNSVNRLQEELLRGKQSINRNSDFAEYFIQDSDHPYYYWNVHIYTSLGH